jgi:hypothetical protein
MDKIIWSISVRIASDLLRRKVEAMQKFLIPILAGVVAVQVGCASYIVVYEPLYPQRYSVGEFAYAARGGELQVDVRGNPFSMIPEQFADRVVAEMKGATRGPDVKFSMAPSGKGSAPYRVVMMFNASATAFGDDACAENAIAVPSNGKDLRLLTTFCNGDVALTESEGWVTNVSGPDDARFRELVRQVAPALIPTHDYNGAEPTVTP